ncbi:hypothetical protein [Rothia uropygialis]|uniref:hypothetical protein n=1 Tax=Kocuria sp. 36 TaxID=1415402 RepID=UPI0013EA0B45|nr:hypothetical protein [Kocuria sp. 36]
MPTSEELRDLGYSEQFIKEHEQFVGTLPTEVRKASDATREHEERELAKAKEGASSHK